MTVYGYARCSTNGQDLTLQQEALRAAGCTKVYSEKMSGARSDRPRLARLLNALDLGDIVIVTRLDRLARSSLCPPVHRRWTAQFARVRDSTVRKTPPGHRKTPPGQSISLSTIPLPTYITARATVMTPSRTPGAEARRGARRRAPRVRRPIGATRSGGWGAADRVERAGKPRGCGRRTSG